MEKVIIVDVGDEALGSNKLFDRAFAFSISHTLLPFCHLSEVASSKNISLITPDVFLKDPHAFADKKVFLVSLLDGPLTNSIIEARATPLAVLCLESPFIATRFYLNLRAKSARFKHAFVFSGMRKGLDRKTQYHQMYFPQSSANVSRHQTPSFKERKLLTMISSAKNIGDWKKDILLKLRFGINVREIYSERLKAIEFFSARKDFDLYGYLWNVIQGNPGLTRAISRCYRGTVANKHDTLKGYKFALCYENSEFPGYITEKIFDCFNAGVVPVYLGAPDIEEYVPESTFINFRKYRSYKDLEARLSSIDEHEFSAYLENIGSFLRSPEYEIFTDEYFANAILSLIEDEPHTS